MNRQAKKIGKRISSIPSNVISPIAPAKGIKNASTPSSGIARTIRISVTIIPSAKAIILEKMLTFGFLNS